MKRIIIKELKDGWQLTMGGGGARKHPRVLVLYNTVERKISRFLASQEKGRTAVRVVYEDKSHNQSLISKSTSYLLHCLACFLEDYLSELALKSKYKKYDKFSEDC